MPDQPKTKHRTIRVPDERWATAERAAKALGMDRSALVNNFLAWVGHEHGAKAPKRPDAAAIEDNA